jgi:DNA-directed RNA polymerase specialized sigma24 family protein
VISSAVHVSVRDAAREQAFDETVRPETRRLFGLALSILRDEGEAQDAVQETLVKAWRSWESLTGTLPLSRWLTRVCVNYCISRRRYLRSRGWPPLQMSELTASPVDPGSRAEAVDMDRVYRRLSLKQRAAIALKYGDGYTDDESGIHAAVPRCAGASRRSGADQSHLRHWIGDAADRHRRTPCAALMSKAVASQRMLRRTFSRSSQATPHSTVQWG